MGRREVALKIIVVCRACKYGISLKQPMFRIRIGSGFSQAIGSGSGFRIRIWIKEGKNYRQKEKNPCFEVLDVLCSLNFLIGGLGIGKL
jgi:hypothetical protein